MGNSHYLQHQLRLKKTFINYVQLGQSGPAIIFIHGWCNNWKGWLPLARYLKKNYRLFLIDLPGFGDSGDLNEYSVERMSDALLDFIKKKHLAPVIIIGLSMGSIVASDLIWKNPNLFKTAILAGPVFKNAKKQSLIAKAIYYSYRFIDKSSKLEYLLKKIVERKLTGYALAKFVNMHEFNKKLIDLYGTQGRQKMRPKAYAQMGESIAKYDMKSALEKINIPVLLIFGKSDKVCSSETVAKYYGDRKKNISVVEIEKAGHVVPLEKPKETSQVIEKFLRS